MKTLLICVTLSILFTYSCASYKQKQFDSYTLEEFSRKHYRDTIELYRQLYSTLSYQRQCRPDNFEGRIPVKLINNKGLLSAEFKSPTDCISSYFGEQMTSLLAKLHFDPTKSEILNFCVYFDYVGEGVESEADSNNVYLKDYLVPNIFFH